jgi:hypothetical protein
MFNSPIDARDDMFEKFNTDFSANALVVETECEIRWQGKPEKAIPTGYFVRVSTKGAGTDQAGYADTEKRYDTYGNLFVQVFAPMDAEDSYRNGELLAIAARDIFKGSETQGGVWFRKARYVELDDDGKFYIWKVTVEFEFSER